MCCKRIFGSRNILFSRRLISTRYAATKLFPIRLQFDSDEKLLSKQRQYYVCLLFCVFFHFFFSLFLSLRFESSLSFVVVHAIDSYSSVLLAGTYCAVSETVKAVTYEIHHIKWIRWGHYFDRRFDDVGSVCVRVGCSGAGEGALSADCWNHVERNIE